MKAKVVETGEIVNVTPYPTWYKEDGQGPDRREWDEDELDFSINSKSKEIDLEEDVERILEEYDWNYNKIDFSEFARYFYNLGLKAQKVK